MKINAKMLVYILSTSMLIFIISLGYITIKSRNLALNEARELATKTARAQANVIQSKLASDFNIAKTLAQAGQAYFSAPWKEWNKIFLEQQLHVITENPNFLAVATSWELNYIDPEWNKPHGRYLNGWVRNQQGEITQLETTLNTNGDDIAGNYYKMKVSGKSMIVDPTLYSPTGKVEDQYLNSNISVPIKLGNAFVGLAGLDLSLDLFQKIILSIKPFENSFAFLISYDGTMVAHPNIEYMGKFIAEIYPELTDLYNIDENIKKGESFSFTHQKANKEKDFYVFAPIRVNNIETPWSLAISVPNKIITSSANAILYNALIVCFIGFALLSIVIWLIAGNISNPIIKVTQVLKNMAQGEIDNSLKMHIKSKDEIGEMTQALNISIEGLNKKARFANLIGEGKINSELDLLSEKDALGKSLLAMRDNLRKAKDEEEQRKEEDKKRRWINEGLAKFADILRKNNDNINVLTTEIIKNLVQYLNVNQGGVFLQDDSETNPPVFNLMSAFAYNREKYFQKRVELGEGLVGTCAREKETIYLTEIPQDYAEITSGLGGANPKSLLLVPLRSENTVLGILELASFSAFEKYEIEFVELVANSIASTLNSVQINIKTAELLERSQQQSEEMAAQEEEMRQNMEELQATQEESSRRSEEFIGTLDAIDRFLIKAELDQRFTIQDANENFLQKFGYKTKEIVGMDAKELVPNKDIKNFQNIINTVLTGRPHQEITNLKSKNNNEFKVVSSFTPVFVNDKIEKILLLAIDMKDFK